MSDRIIGIQQIFGIDVGSDQDQRRLEWKLSVQLNQRCPPLAQAFVHMYAVKAPFWQTRLGTYVKSKYYSTDPDSNYNPHVRKHKGNISGSTAGMEDTMWIPEEFFNAEEVEAAGTERPVISGGTGPTLRFQGDSFPFEDLWNEWRSTERARLPPSRRTMIYPDDPAEKRYQNAFECSIYLDSSDWVTDAGVNIQPPGFARFTQPLELAQEICERCPKEVMIHVLGKVRASPAEGSAQAWVGLLTADRGRDDIRERIGFCTWRGDRVAAQACEDDCDIA